MYENYFPKFKFKREKTFLGKADIVLDSTKYRKFREFS